MEKETYHPLGGALHSLDRSLMLLHVFYSQLASFRRQSGRTNLTGFLRVGGRCQKQPITTQFLLAFSIMIFLLWNNKFTKFPVASPPPAAAGAAGAAADGDVPADAGAAAAV